MRTVIWTALVLALSGSACAGPPSAGPPGQAAIVSSKETTMHQSTASSTARRVSASGYDITPLDDQQVAELASSLDDSSYRVTQKAGTERAFSGSYWSTKEQGVYLCAVCGLPLFSSQAKYDSGSGWPSFWQPFDPEHLLRAADRSLLGMARTEVRCARCGAHQGHVFDDGPAPSGKRYCINSAALQLADKAPSPHLAQQEQAGPAAAGTAVATFAAGCFWGVEAAFRRIDGVRFTQVGYTGGSTADPSYRQVCNGHTGHAEAVEVRYDPAKVSYGELLEVFWASHDPTQLNRQGPDLGDQYRSAIFYADDAQRQAAVSARERLQASGKLGRPVVTEIVPTATFYRAEEYHQQYLEKNGSAACPSHLAR